MPAIEPDVAPDRGVRLRSFAVLLLSAQTCVRLGDRWVISSAIARIGREWQWCLGGRGARHSSRPRFSDAIYSGLGLLRILYGFAAAALGLLNYCFFAAIACWAVDGAVPAGP